jgi:NAD(P)-dependent dehydrogenase (short-subunit alcohol dehydrogenase family)
MVTGAAKRIGRAICEHLVARGYDIVLHYHQSCAEAQSVATALRAQGAEVQLVQKNLAALHLLHELWNDLPPCDMLIHNASLFARDTAADCDSHALEAHMQVNMLAPVLLSQQFARQLPAGKHGQVIFLSDSVLGWSISPQFFSYAASKLALNSATDLLAAALAPHIRVNTIALGPTLENTHDKEGLFAKLAQAAPLKRTSVPADVLAALDYLRHAEGVTGQILSLSGGMHLATAKKL